MTLRDQSLRRPRLIFAVLTAILPALAYGQVPVGPEFRVNTYTTGDQADPTVAGAADGSFVVAWSSYPQDGSQDGIYARRYDLDAGPLDGVEFRVSQATQGRQRGVVPAVGPDGGITFVWDAPGQTDSSADVYARRFDAFGTPEGEFVVNSYTTGNQASPSITMRATGEFVVVWSTVLGNFSSRVIVAQRFDAAGVAQGGQFMVNAYTTGFRQISARAAAFAPDGGFVIVWTGAAEDGGSNGVFGQRFAADGNRAEPPFRITAYSVGTLAGASVASDSSGNFVVTWDRWAGGAFETDVVARRFDASGAPQGPEFVVSTYTTGQQAYSDVAIDDRGNFLVVWNGLDPGGTETYEAFGRMFNATEPATPEFRLGIATAQARRAPAVTANVNGDFTVAWVGMDAPGSFGVFARQFRGDLIFADDFEAGELSAWSSNETDTGDLAAGTAGGMDGTLMGLEGIVDDPAALYVEDDSPDSEPRYRARFWIDPNGFDPGVAQGHLRTRVFIAFTEAPNRRVAAIVLRLQAGAYSLMGRARLDDDRQADTGFFPISAGPHAVEVDLKPANAGAQDGTFELFIDGESKAQLSGLANSMAAVDLVRLGALSAKSGANGTLYWDEFESRRMSYIGP